MKKSDAVAAALRRFYELNSANAQDKFGEIVSASEDILIIGSAAREWFNGQAAARAAFGLEGVAVEPGMIDAYEDGDVGWAFNRPTFVLPDGTTRMRLRMTTIFHRENGRWKLVHIHGSTPVPDEVYLQHQAEWWPD